MGNSSTSKTVLIIFIVLFTLCICTICSIIGISMFVANNSPKVIIPTPRPTKEISDNTYDDITPDEVRDSIDSDTDNLTSDESTDTKAPSGFSMVNCKNLKAHFYKPNGWYLYEEPGDTKACFITKESISGGGSFKTGMSVNLVENVESKTGYSPEEYAKNIAEKAGKEYEAGEIKTGGDGVMFKGYGRELTVEGTYKIKEYILVMADVNNDKVYIITFESPADEWTNTWKQYGFPMIQNLGFEA